MGVGGVGKCLNVQTEKAIYDWFDTGTIYNGELVSLGQSIFEILKLNRKQKLFRTLGFFLDFFPQLISATGSRDSPPVYLVTMGPPVYPTI